MRLPDKTKVLEALLSHLTQDATQAAARANSTREAATHAEAKPENDKDTRALEQSYLARGQAMRVEELHEQIQGLRSLPLRDYGEHDPIGAGALVQLASEEGSRCLFLAPHGGGVELSVDGMRVHVITPQSPLGAQLLGRSLGDEIELRVRGERKEYVIDALR
jgi:hypothetical protein